MRTRLASLVGRLAAAASRRRGGGGSSLPGLLGLKIDPSLIRRAARDLAGTVVVTGTNGKTTTSRFIGQSLKRAGRPYLHNQSGSNLLRGIASSLVLHRPTRTGAGKTWGLFEVDEATMPAACRELQPTVVVVTNLFRDQLDRYGELHRTADYLRDGLRSLPAEATVVLNADDPLVASLGTGLRAKVRYFGIEDTSASRQTLAHAADSLSDPQTGELLEYSAVFLGHLGHYRGSSRFRRPKPGVALTKVKLNGLAGSTLTVREGKRSFGLELRLPGLYNAYNALAAVAAGSALGLPVALTHQAIAGTAAAFGRVEQVSVGDRKLFIGLIKNPTGTNEVIHTLALDGRPKDLLIMINDNFADGRDVSWLWDADFEELLPHLRGVTVSGTRAADMAVRLKYAGLSPDKIIVQEKVSEALGAALAGAPARGTVYALPTYTAMLDLRQELFRRSLVGHYLEET